jgi:hypothetical protein
MKIDTQYLQGFVEKVKQQSEVSVQVVPQFAASSVRKP